ncbi:hypothetical protein RLOC_00010631 [Lonchura striata]|uniref:Uncharacterized protein n=1 Tax=Lonchura striata TaxID=40157 RepID=A0A218UEK4_9PASE|nr:hypothetical protein RLOC_00010631 [Lonchura striata domestica]
MGRRSSCRSGTRRDRSASKPSPRPITAEPWPSARWLGTSCTNPSGKAKRSRPAAPPVSSRRSTVPRPTGMSTRAAARPRWRRSASGASWARLWPWRRRRRRSWCCGSACWTGGRWRRSANRSSPFSRRLPRAGSREFRWPGAAGGGAALPGCPDRERCWDLPWDSIQGMPRGGMWDKPWSLLRSGGNPRPPSTGICSGCPHRSRRGVWNKSWSWFLG